MNPDLLRARYLSAMGLSSLAGVFSAACEPTTHSGSPANPSDLSSVPTAMQIPEASPAQSVDASAPGAMPSTAGSEANSVSATPTALPNPVLPKDAGAPMSLQGDGGHTSAVASTQTRQAKPPWSVTFRKPQAPYEYCRTGHAQCFFAEDVPQGMGGPIPPTARDAAPSPLRECPRAIPATCDCNPHAGCFDQGATCSAGLDAAVSLRERKNRPHACCYATDERCAPPGEGRRWCINNEPVVAPAVSRHDWLMNDLRLSVDRIDESKAALWIARASSEHASVASFAHASLQLLALGAPPDLLRETHQAALDEIEHARLAYAMAARYSMHAPKGPGHLPIPTCTMRPTFESLTRDTFRDACVSESLAAVRLRGEADVDLAVAPWLLRLAVDEERHAELGWKTLAWLVREGGRAAVLALESELLQLDALDATIQQVIIPCAHALLSSLPVHSAGDLDTTYNENSSPLTPS